MGIKIKEFINGYDDYVKLQKSKSPHGSDLNRRLSMGGDLWDSDCEGFKKHFLLHKDIIENSKKAICLGARTGQEVYVLKNMGLEDSIGIDLVDAPPLVIEGDVHNVQFEDNTFDFIFSNIFDHVLYPDKFISEIERLAKPNTYCILHLSIGIKMEDGGDFHAANELSDSNSVIQLFKRNVEIIKNEPLNQPNWPDFLELVVKIN